MYKSLRFVKINSGKLTTNKIIIKIHRFLITNSYIKKYCDKKLLNLSDFSKNELTEILNSTSTPEVLRNKNIGTIYEKYSTRTRISLLLAFIS